MVTMTSSSEMKWVENYSGTISVFKKTGMEGISAF